MVCTHVDLCLYQEEGCWAWGGGWRGFIALFVLILLWWLHFSTSIQSLITCSLKLLVQVIQLRFYLILRVAFCSSHSFFSSPSRWVWGPPWGWEGTLPSTRKEWREELNLKAKRQPAYEPLSSQIKTVRQRWEARNRDHCHYSVILLKRED